MKTIQYRRLGKSDLRVSNIGMGCVTFGRGIDRDTSFEIMDRALDGGITLFDTAAVHGGGASETVLGQWGASRGVRRRIVLATKVSGTLTREHILASAEESLQRLRADRINLLQSGTRSRNGGLRLRVVPDSVTQGRCSAC